MDDPGVRASLAAIACAGACFATPAVYLRARTWAQQRTLRVVRSGLSTVLAVQRWESRAATGFFEVTAFSVSVPFYALALPLLAWVRAAGRRRVCHTASSRRALTLRPAPQTGNVLLCRKLTVLMTRACAVCSRRRAC